MQPFLTSVRSLVRGVAASVFISAMLAPTSFAQQPRDVAVEGYITASNLPASFDVNGMQVTLKQSTGFGLTGDRIFRTDSPLRDQLRIGAYVSIRGNYNDRKQIATADAVLFRPDWDKKLSGVGVIDQLVTDGPEPVYRADGYLIRITAATEKTFKGDMQLLAEVKTNSWIAFEGKRDSIGVLLATEATFLPPRPTKIKAVPILEVATVQIKPADAKDNSSTQSATGTLPTSGGGSSLTQDQKLKIGLRRWHTLPADKPLQQRVERIGLSLVPKYQRTMADDDPSKIHFRFFAVDYKGARNEICLFDGVVLIPTQMIERLQNDDQLAAVLADGVASHLQRQAADYLKNLRIGLAYIAAMNVASVAFPPLGLAIMAGGFVGGNQLDLMQEDRARIALALMQDAGYNPRQAPEAWRLMAPKKLPKDLSTLLYPGISGYQLGILNLQYRTSPAAASR
jgi:hypothetical protein